MVVEAVHAQEETSKVKPVNLLDLGAGGTGWLDGVWTGIVRREEGDIARHGLEDGGILGEDAMSEKPIANIRRDGGSIGVELNLKDKEQFMGGNASEGHEHCLGKRERKEGSSVMICRIE